MKQKAFCIIGAIAAGVFAFAVYFSAEKSIITNELLLANVEALVQNENNSSTKCPNPYDVPDMTMAYPQHTATVGANADGEIIIGGFKLPITGSGGASVTITYHISECSRPAPKACCPYADAGKVTVIACAPAQ